jgi:ferric-chelate reductase (NADPH)
MQAETRIAVSARDLPHETAARTHTRDMRLRGNMETPLPEYSNEVKSNVLVRSLRKWLLRPSHVASVETLSANFRLIDLQGDALKAIEWIPGQQIQITTGAGFTGRTYTPISWDHDGGSARLVIFLHGNGPGCTWARTVRPGSRHDFNGPTRPLKLAMDEPFTLFGDETTFGLGLALQHAASHSMKPRFHFEVSDLEESQRVLNSIGLRGAELVERSEGYEHLTETASALSVVANEEQQIVLSGNARSIQEIKKVIATKSKRTPRFIVKPYWSPGKRGLS